MLNTRAVEDRSDPRPGIAVVLLSGGLDSCVTAAMASLDHELALLHLDYGQLTAERELQAFTAIADHLGVEQRLVCQLPHLRQIGGSSLIGGQRKEELTHADLPDTYVPFRNANLLAVAVSWAETLRASSVFIGAHQADSPYPDCSEEFFTAFSDAVDQGTDPNAGIGIRTPLLHLDKAAIVRRGIELDAPLHLTWSCYTDSQKACGACRSCELRRRGFAAAGTADPSLIV